MINITISESLKIVLNDLGYIDGIQASALVSNEGILMESNINTHSVDTKTFSAVIAMLTRSANHTAKELNKGEIEYLVLFTKNGQIIIKKIASYAILTVLTETGTNASLIIGEMKRASEEIQNIFAHL